MKIQTKDCVAELNKMETINSDNYKKRLTKSEFKKLQVKTPIRKLLQKMKRYYFTSSTTGNTRCKTVSFTDTVITLNLESGKEVKLINEPALQKVREKTFKVKVISTKGKIYDDTIRFPFEPRVNKVEKILKELNL